MHFTLFGLAGWAGLAWLLMILLPTWRVTRGLARSAVFPIYLCLLYAVGISVVLRSTGLGVMSEFGSAAGVIRILRREDVALIAWIHLLAFDQFVGLWIYRDNMRRRYLPIPLQSVLLFLTLMLGPLGLLAYWVLRLVRRAPAAEGRLGAQLLQASDPFGDAAPEEGPPEAAITTAFGPAPGGDLDDRIAAMPSPVASPWRYARTVFAREERALTSTGLLGLVLGAVVGVIALAHGPVIAPEGALSKPASFDIALGIYTLTIALFVPLARMRRRTAARWRTASVVLTLVAYAIENVQSLRGLDPRFSHVAGPVDVAIGRFFFLVALALIGLFWTLAMRFFDLPRPEPEANLALSLRYAFGATMLAFAAGFVMSIVVSGRMVGRSGNLLTLHALGFHGLQAVPLVALFLARARIDAARARAWIHAAGLAWMAACVLVAAQTAAGLSITAPSLASVGTAVTLLAWTGIALFAFLRATGRTADARTAA